MAQLSPLRRRMIEDMTVRNISARSARLCVGHAFVRQKVATDPLHHSINQRLL
jgi:hypothetical protein